MAKAKPLPPEWSFQVDADKIGVKPLEIAIKPNTEERKLLAQRLGLKSLDSLEASLSFVRESAVTVHVNGSFKAHVTQNCVVSGKLMKSEIQEKFEAWYADKSKALSFTKARQEKEIQKGKTELPMLEENEDPEPIIDGKIDAGELVTQYLSLAIDPYPHAEGAEYDPGPQSEGAKEDIANPFAALKDWKAKKNKD